MSFLSGIGDFLRRDVLNPIEGAVGIRTQPHPQASPQAPQQPPIAPKAPQLILKSGFQPQQFDQTNQNKINFNPQQTVQPPKPNLNQANPLTKNPLVGSPSKPGPNSTMKIASATPPVKNGMNRIKVNVATPQNLQIGNQTITPSGGRSGVPEPPKPTLAHDLTHNVVTNAIGGTVKSLASIPEYFGKVDIINPARELSAQVTHNPAAYEAQLRRSNIDLGLGSQGDNLKGGLGKLGGNATELATLVAGGPLTRGIEAGVSKVVAPPLVKYATGAISGPVLNTAFNLASLPANNAPLTKKNVSGAIKSGSISGETFGVGGPLASDVIKGGIKLAQNRIPLNEAGAVGKNVPSPAEEPPAETSTPVEPKLNNKTAGQGSEHIPNSLNADAMSKTFNIPKEEAQNTIDNMRQTDANQVPLFSDLSAEDRANLSPEEQMALAQLEGMGPRGPADITTPWQQTLNQPTLEVPEGSHESAIAQASGLVAERNSLYDDAINAGRKLSQNDQSKLSDAIHGEKVGKIDNPELFNDVAARIKNANDYDLALRRLAGAKTARFNNGDFSHTFYQADKEAMDKLGIPEDQRYELNGKTGFAGDTSAKVSGAFGDAHEIPRKYRSYAEASQSTNGILKPLFNNALEDEAHYRDVSSRSLEGHLLKQALIQSNPTDIAELGYGREEGGAPFRQAPGGLPFNASSDIRGALKNYGEAWTPDSTVGKIAEKGLRIAGAGTKKSLFFLSYFHQAHITENFGFAGALGREPRAFTDGLIQEFKTKGGLSKSSYYDVLDHYRNDAHDGLPSTMEYARAAGYELQPNSALGRFVDSYVLSSAKAMKESGIDARSQEGVDVAKIYNRLAGREGAKVAGLNPTVEKFTSYFALAPHYLRTQLKLVTDAMLPKKLGGAGYDAFFKGTTPGGAARSAVVGPRLFGAITAVTASAIIMHRFPTWQDMLNESGLNPNNPNPNIDIKSKNKKGEKQVMNLPTDPIGLAVGFVTDPQHFLQSRYSPALSFGAKVVTNKNWNGQPLVDTNQPGQWPKRIGRAAENAFLPIGVQNFTNLQHNINNPNIEQGIGQEFGLRLKTDPNDPQVKANAAYFKAFNSASDELKKSGQYGQYWAQEFNALHPQNTTDAEGNKYPTPYNPVSSEQKYAAYTAVDKNGKQTLSPVFYADQKLSNMTKGYPSSPLYKLSGNGTDAEGNNSPKALVALQYQHAQDPAAKQVIMNANGGQNGWLAKYETQVGQYAQNYQKNLTNYFQSLGWSQTAIDDYWKKHPSTPDPIDQVNFDKPTTDLINKYYQLSASGDSTAASTFFSDHADTLGNAFDLLAQHANAIRAAKGEVQLEGYPSESQHVKDILGSMPQGADKASKKARAQLINSNPDVDQYLANVALYETLSKGAQFRYKNPANMNNTQVQNLYEGGNNAQGFLKSAKSLGTYDIGYNPNAPAGQQYQFMGAGGTGAFGTGYASSSGSGSSKKQKTPYFVTKHAKLPRKPRIHKMKKTYLKYSSKTSGGKGAGVKVGKAQTINFASARSIPINTAKAPSSNAIKYAG